MFLGVSVPLFCSAFLSSLISLASFHNNNNNHCICLYILIRKVSGQSIYITESLNSISLHLHLLIACYYNVLMFHSYICIDDVEAVLRQFHRCCYRSSPLWFFYWKRALASWSFAMDERDGHQDLRGSGRRSVIPYVHERIELYCSSLPCLSLSFLF
jgi:hypothetical protein